MDYSIFSYKDKLHNNNLSDFYNFNINNINNFNNNIINIINTIIICYNIYIYTYYNKLL